MDLSGVFCVADSGVLQDAFLWNCVGMHTCSVWFSNTNPTENANVFGSFCEKHWHFGQSQSLPALLLFIALAFWLELQLTGDASSTGYAGWCDFPVCY